MRSGKLVFLQIVSTFNCVREVSHVGQIFWPFMAANRANMGQYIVFHIFS